MQRPLQNVTIFHGCNHALNIGKTVLTSPTIRYTSPVGALRLHYLSSEKSVAACKEAVERLRVVQPSRKGSDPNLFHNIYCEQHLVLHKPEFARLIWNRHTTKRKYCFCDMLLPMRI